jgi:hypothetical protein
MNGKVPNGAELEQKVFALKNEESPDQIAWEVFQFQFNHNPVYRRYCELIGRTPESLRDPTPFLTCRSHFLKRMILYPEPAGLP